MSKLTVFAAFTSLLLISLSSCSFTSKSRPSNNNNISSLDLILQAEGKADAKGRAVLATGRMMTLEDKLILPGSCWDYANEVFNRSGFPNSRSKRKTVFKSIKRGPYADVSLIKPGDFLYYVNHSYGGVEHSAIFVSWINYVTKQALMLSYGGERRKDPARYLPYDLSNVYHITRAI